MMHITELIIVVGNQLQVYKVGEGGVTEIEQLATGFFEVSKEHIAELKKELITLDVNAPHVCIQREIEDITDLTHETADYEEYPEY